MPPVSLVVIAHNSESTLAECLRSARGWTTEQVLVDDHSTDRTPSLARELGARVLSHKLESCARQKQYAVDQAAQDWIFLLDSDEACSEELAREIQKTVDSPAGCDAFRVPRRNFYFGRWLRYGGKYPDYQVRLFRKSRARYSDHFSHEKVIVQGRTGTLRGWIVHQAYPDLDTWLLKLKRTAEFDALEWERNGVRPSGWNAFRLCFLRPSNRFIRKYLFKGGFLDGWPGFLACVHDFLTQVLTYHILAQNLQRPKP